MNFNKLVPQDSFIGRYMQVSSAFETSTVYDFWAAVWALGTVCGRGVYVPRPNAPVFMNWYAMFVAESGITRKSTAVRMARNIVSSVLGSDHMLEGKCTPEFLHTQLVLKPHTAIAVSELVTFLGRESYIIDLPAMLTDLYDCPAERTGGTMSKGKLSVVYPYVTFLTASTPSWLRTSVNPTVIEGGFTSRCLFIHDEKPKAKIAWPQEDADIDELTDLVTRVSKRAQEVGEIDLMPSGMSRFTTWYKGRDTSSIVPFLASFNSREDAHVLRMAACLAINDGTMAIERQHINSAIKLITLAKANAVSIFSDTGNSIKIAQGIDRVVQLLIEAGPIGIPHTRLYTSVRYYIQRDEFHILITAMAELGMITKLQENRMGAGRKGVRYVRNDAMTNRRKMDELMQMFVT